MRWIGRVVSGVLLSAVLAAVALPWSGRAQAGVPEVPRFRAIGVDDGLPATGVNAIVRDAAGYVWVGTSDGLARYDGTGFRVWRHQPGDPQSLPGNNVQEIGRASCRERACSSEVAVEYRRERQRYDT